MDGFIKKFKNVYLKDLTTVQIQAELNKLKHNRTKERICLYMNAILQKACDLGILHINVFKAVVKEKKNTYKNKCYIFAEQATILSKLKDYGIEHEIMIYLMTGCRPHELPHKKQFDFENNLVHIYGGKNENAEHRVVEITKKFADYIKDYFKNNDIKKYNFIYRQFKKLCDDNKIGKPIIYRLRHTFATNHFTLKTHVKYIQHWLGHSSVKITLDTYTDIDRTSSIEKIRKLYNNFYYEI